MPSTKGKSALESNHGSNVRPTSNAYCPPWEIDAFRHHALGRMMTGLGLSLVGIVLGLISPAVGAQNDYPAPDAIQLGAIGLVAMVLVLALLALLKRNGRHATNRHQSGHKPSVSHHASEAKPDAFTLLDQATIVGKVQQHFERCRNQQDYLGLLRIGIDHDVEPGSSYAAAALGETVDSIAKSRGAHLLPARDGEFIVVLSGDLPDQAEQISNDFREAIADLALTGSAGIITASVGLFVARPDGDCRPEHYLERAAKALDVARSRGGNRVESETV